VFNVLQDVKTVRIKLAVSLVRKGFTSQSLCAACAQIGVRFARLSKNVRFVKRVTQKWNQEHASKTRQTYKLWQEW